MKDLPANLVADGYTIRDGAGKAVGECKTMRIVTVLVDLYNERQAVLEKMRTDGGEVLPR